MIAIVQGDLMDIVWVLYTLSLFGIVLYPEKDNNHVRNL